MGTNFYTASGIHLGKRSSAGPYCWACGITLCKQGESGIHRGDSEWYDACPNCGARKQGSSVSSCCSFTWARSIGRVRKIVDEYGEEYTREDFERVLEECPVQYKMYGVEFS